MTQTIHSSGQVALRDALVSARQSANLTQQELAKRLKCHQSMIARIESGERRIDVVELVKICSALGISANQIFDKIRAAVDPASGL